MLTSPADQGACIPPTATPHGEPGEPGEPGEAALRWKTPACLLLPLLVSEVRVADGAEAEAAEASEVLGGAKEKSQPETPASLSAERFPGFLAYLPRQPAARSARAKGLSGALLSRLLLQGGLFCSRLELNCGTGTSRRIKDAKLISEKKGCSCTSVVRVAPSRLAGSLSIVASMSVRALPDTY